MKQKRRVFAVPDDRMWYYVVANYNGKQLIDRKPTEQEAYSFGYSKLQIPFEVIPLQTRDIKRAKAIIRDMRLQNGEGIEQSMSPIYRIK